MSTKVSISYSHSDREFVPEEMIPQPEAVLIPAGEFVMGSDDEPDDQGPPHDICLPDYRIAKYPVTNREYEAFARDTLRGPERWEAHRYPQGDGDHPVVWVSWYDAVAYCLWLNRKTGKVYHLPSEAEWEKAASWDPRTKRKRRYPWGDRFDPNKCNTNESGIEDTTPLGKYSPEGDSAYGVADMAGNVWEWTRSLWGTDFRKPDFGYPYDPDDGREDSEAPGLRVLRGGSWAVDQRDARCAVRLGLYPGYRSLSVGFRVVVSPGPPYLVSGFGICEFWSREGRERLMQFGRRNWQFG